MGSEDAEQNNAKMNSERKFLTELLETALVGDGQKVKSLVVDYAGKHHISNFEVLSQFKDGNKRTALHFACTSPSKSAEGENSDIDILEFLLGGGKWLSTSAVEQLCRQKDKEGMTLLMLCCQLEDRDLAFQRIQFLLKIGSHKLALARSNAGATALHYAAGNGCGAEITSIIYKAAPIALKTNSKKGGNPLHWIAGVGPRGEQYSAYYVDTLTTLLDKNASADTDNNIINSLNEQGLPPLILAAAASNDKHASILIKKGGNALDVTNVLPGNITVFHMAADLNLVLTLKALLEWEVEKEKNNVNNNDNNDNEKEETPKISQMENSMGESPLDLACKEKHLECVQLLLGPDKDAHAFMQQYEKDHKGQQQQQHQQPQSDDISEQPPTENKSEQKDELLQEAECIFNKIKDSYNKAPADEQTEKTALDHKADGNQHYVKKEYEQAIQSYTKAIDNSSGMSPDTIATFFSNRSACYNALNMGKSALQDALVTKLLRPDWPKSYFRVATAQLSLERFEDAACSAWEGLAKDQQNDELKSLLQKSVRQGKKDHFGKKKNTEEK